MDKRRRVLRAAELLEAEYGLPRWSQEKHDPISTLVGTILSQNTSDRNSIPAFNALRRRYPTWEKVLAAKESGIASAIRKGGLANIKAKRIKGVLSEIRGRTGRLSLDFLRKKSKEEAREFLLSLKGVGWKTASVVLIFSLQKPAFPVDRHIFRVSKRLGFIPERATLEEAHKLMDVLVPDEKKGPLHVNLIYLGRGLCHPRHPDCPHCPLKRICPGAFKLG